MFTRAYRYAIPVLRTGMQYQYCVPVRTCKHNCNMYCVPVLRTGTQYRYARVNKLETCIAYRYCIPVRNTCIAYRYARVNKLETCMRYMCAGLNMFKLGGLYAGHVCSWIFMFCRSYSPRRFYASKTSSSDVLSQRLTILYIMMRYIEAHTRRCEEL